MLAARFGSAMAPAMGLEQAAFLPGRQIGDNIMALQLMPALLTALGLSGAVVSLDIAQTYYSACRYGGQGGWWGHGTVGTAAVV